MGTTQRMAPMRTARRKFLRLFPEGFADPTYLAWERDYKWSAHRAWRADIGDASAMAAAVAQGRARDVAATAVRIEASRPLLYSFEKMALRDAAVRSRSGATRFGTGLADWLTGSGTERDRFERWVEVVEGLPSQRRRVATWPVVTDFGFIARPRVHCFLKPRAMQRAADVLGHDLDYSPRPKWQTYANFLALCRAVSDELGDLGPRDQIDVQSFLWVTGSDEYS